MTPDFDNVLGHGPDGTPVGLLTLTSDTLRVGLTNYGARMLSIEAPDRNGHSDHVLLGFDRADMILKAGSFGAVIGRYANRIAGGRFTLDGTTYQLSQNDGGNTLHGGKQAIAKTFWTVAERSATHVVFTIESPDGDQGFPGAVSIRATYRLDSDTLNLALEATTSKPTPLNLSAHPYFNLAGAAALDVCDHTVQVKASAFLPTDATQIPTGEIRPVAGTPFDLRAPVLIGSRIRGDDTQLLYARGFDHHFILDDTKDVAVRMAHPASGRVLEITTTQAGVQVYTGNSLNGSLVGHGGTYRQTAGIAFEPQAYPDAPNHPAFPSTILRPGEAYRQVIAYRFACEAR
jgi:aldose 1-epimerase